MHGKFGKYKNTEKYTILTKKGRLHVNTLFLRFACDVSLLTIKNFPFTTLKFLYFFGIPKIEPRTLLFLFKILKDGPHYCNKLISSYTLSHNYFPEVLKVLWIKH